MVPGQGIFLKEGVKVKWFLLAGALIGIGLPVVFTVLKVRSDMKSGKVDKLPNKRETW